MSAERTVASSSGHQRLDEQAASGPFVVAPRAATGGRAGTRARRPARARRSTAALATVDAVAALAGVLCLDEPRQYGVLACLLLAGVLSLNVRGRLYQCAVLPATLDEAPALAGRIALSWCVLAVLGTVLPPRVWLSPTTLVTVVAVQTLLCVCGRALVHWYQRSGVRRRPSPVLVLGPAGQARSVAAALLRRPGCGMRPVGVVSASPEEAQDRTGDPAPEAPPELPVLSTEDELHRAVIQNDVRSVLILAGHGVESPAGRRVLDDLGCDLWELDACCPGPAAPLPDRGRRYHVAGFACRPLSAGDRGTSADKRTLDIAVSAVLLLVAAPVLLGCALVLRVVEGPGVIFRQERVGKDGRLFTLLKFRTHRPANPQEAATRWSVADEQRMGPFCRFLRSTSLDELPQLWNVLCGDISLVGPRPERPFFVAQFSQTYPNYAQRHRMPTGITGLAQIHGLRGDTSIEDRCRFDNAYIDSWSFWQDLAILLRTLGCLVRRTGS
ncbi:exopolysaccharide biosynthesis polyprenyl glycosylphosphotransferase [Streptomyces kanamyceticus]|uniref:Exopolysaccharide biosynthesis polyprenyl glycosylphosphotransferase n=1 Tax=Streptomyces kanamyceticus TaxID=1967 RepID=A0A5J6GQQ7_STRKN|nr:exopolysaccharide biosynthesis polyprenyl glycosylphosphotransferase [Streptomyces kanamyceticus]QEU97627.1 exopolysaccharide biosynthesis polyprenyl glycosylphosphotransferase [Streptomyces kanamyceticus]